MWDRFGLIPNCRGWLVNRRPSQAEDEIAPRPANEVLVGGAEFAWNEKRVLQSDLIDGRYQRIAVACSTEGAGAGPKGMSRLRLVAANRCIGQQ